MRDVERIWQEVDEQAAAEFLRRFLQLKSANPPGEELEAAHLVCNWMSRPGLEAEVILLQGKRVNPLGRLKFKCRRHPLLGRPTLSIGTISGGIKTNVVPDGCRIAVDIRTVPGRDHKAILAQVEGLLKELARKDDDLRGEARILSDLPTLLTPPRDPLVKVALKAAQAVTGQAHKPRRVMYYTDGVAFVPQLKIPMVICGPGKAGLVS
jgi:succinyl-diaminopimelate desuccinylase